MRVREARGDLDLTEEPLRAKRLGYFGAHYLDGHAAAVLAVFGKDDAGHPAMADLAVDRIAA